jgi:hypothetical protein
VPTANVGTKRGSRHRLCQAVGTGKLGDCELTSSNFCALYPYAISPDFFPSMHPMWIAFIVSNEWQKMIKKINKKIF